MQFSAPALLPLALSLFAIACGGSSSETPPPLEPDPTSLRYTGPRFPRANDVAAPVAENPEPADEDDLPVKDKKPAMGTWGNGKTPAPAVSPEGSGKTPAPAVSSEGSGKTPAPAVSSEGAGQR